MSLELYELCHVMQSFILIYIERNCYQRSEDIDKTSSQQLNSHGAQILCADEW
jgi:hypothetical protein